MKALLTMRMSPRPPVALAGLLCAAALAAVTPAGAAWVDGGVPVCTAPAEQQRPVVVPTFNDGAIVVWWDARNGSYGIYAQRLDADGSPMWGPNGVQVGEILSSSLDRPLAISDQAGGAYVVWSTTGFESPRERLIVQRIDAGGTRLWGNGVVVSNYANSDQMHPVGVSDLRPPNFLNQPGIIIAWEEHAGGNVDIYAQRVDQNGVRGWGDNAARLSTSGAAFEPVICPDGTNTQTLAGGAIVAWTYHGIHSDIRANRVDVAGAVQWGAEGVAICTATGDQISPAITGPSGSRTAYISWIDGRDPDGSDIYAQRVVDGVVSWAANGVPVCIAAGDQSNPVLVNAAVGAYVVWEDGRGASGSDLYAQRVDPNGIAQWAANGLPLCSAPGNQFRARMIGNGAGDAFVSWVDDRDGSQDIYAQRMNANGAFIWQQNGDLVTAAANDQDEPRLAWNGTWLFATWEDLRNNNGNDNYDIYAGRLSPNGIAAAVEPAEAAPASAAGDLRVRLLSANPLGAEVRFALELAGAAQVEADVFDAQGRRVRRLGGEALAAGTHLRRWDGLNDGGQEEPSGVYFLRIRAGGGAEVVKLVRTR